MMLCPTHTHTHTHIYIKQIQAVAGGASAREKPSVRGREIFLESMHFKETVT